MQLPLSTLAIPLAEAILSTQGRCRVGLVDDPYALAKRVRIALSRVAKIGQALNIDLEDMHFSGVFYEGGVSSHSGDTTLIIVDHYSGIKVKRSKPWTVAENGTITITLAETPNLNGVP